jgi:hypothetical protein
VSNLSRVIKIAPERTAKYIKMKNIPQIVFLDLIEWCKIPIIWSPIGTGLAAVPVPAQFLRQFGSQIP